jgi:hypothetical protein
MPQVIAKPASRTGSASIALARRVLDMRLAPVQSPVAESERSYADSQEIADAESEAQR